MYCYKYSGSLYRMFFYQVRNFWSYILIIKVTLLKKVLLGTTWLIQFDEFLSINSMFVMCPKGILCQYGNRNMINGSLALYRENAIATESEARYPNGGNVYYITMQITFPVPESARKERNCCDEVHISTVWLSRLVLEHAIAAIQTSR